MMFYIQCLEQFDMGVRPAASAKPHEDTQEFFMYFSA